MSIEEIRELQDEVKVLKNEIKQALLDIREYLLTSPHLPVSGAVASSPGEAAVAQLPGPTPAVEPEPELSWEKGKEQPEIKRPIYKEASRSYSPDLLTIATLSQWIGRTMEAIGQEQTKTVIEVFEMMERLPPALKETLLRFSRLGDGESPEKKALMELDEILSRRQSSGEGRIGSLLR